MFRKSADATKALATVKTKGFKDSFIVALSGNKSVSSDRAALLEKEWFNKSLIRLTGHSRIFRMIPYLQPSLTGSR